MFDLNISFASLFSGCFIWRRQCETGKLDLQSINEFIGEIEDPMEKLNMIFDYIYSGNKYSVLILTKEKNVVLRRNFNPFQIGQYNLVAIPILDGNEKLLGTLRLGTFKQFDKSDEFDGLIKLIAGVLKMI